MTKHTPGPWEVSRGYNQTGYPCFYINGISAAGEQFHNIAMLDANAKLIAAAPELLELAQRLASECAECDGRGFVYGDDGVSGRGPDDVEPTRVACAECDDIRAVIAKATSHS